MPLFRLLVCAALLAPISMGCDAPPNPPKPTIEIDKKVEALGDKVKKTRAEAAKRNDAASKAAVVANATDTASDADASGD